MTIIVSSVLVDPDLFVTFVSVLVDPDFITSVFFSSPVFT